MHVRTRGDNYYLERAEYTKAIRDESGKVIRRPARTTKYLFSVSKYSRFKDISSTGMLEVFHLTEEEIEQLKALLAVNEPWGDEMLVAAEGAIISTFAELARLKGATGERKARIKSRIKAIDDAYQVFFKACQSDGFRTTREGKPGEVAA